jgi:hypothetical protein
VLATASVCTVIMYNVACCLAIAPSVALLALVYVPTYGDRSAHPLPLPVAALLCSLRLSPHIVPLAGAARLSLVTIMFPLSKYCPWFNMLWAPPFVYL